MVKISLSNAADEGTVPDQGAKILHASWLKKPGHETTEAIVTNSIKTVQMVHIKKKIKRKKTKTRILSQ